MGFMVLPRAKNVVFQLADGVMAFRPVAGRDYEAEGMGARAREDKLVD